MLMQHVTSHARILYTNVSMFYVHVMLYAHAIMLCNVSRLMFMSYVNVIMLCSRNVLCLSMSYVMLGYTNYINYKHLLETAFLVAS